MSTPPTTNSLIVRPRDTLATKPQIKGDQEIT